MAPLPVLWATDAVFLDGAGCKSFLRYVENNPMPAQLKGEGDGLGMVERAGEDAGGVCLDAWRHLFGNPAGNPAGAAEAWKGYLEGPVDEVRRNAGLRPGTYHRVTG